MMTFRFATLAVAAFGIAGAPVASAETAVFFDSRDAFVAALGGAPVTEQDFSGYANGANLSGAAILPGLVAQSPFPTLEARAGADTVMFGFGGGVRQTLDGYYEFASSAGYTAFGFDIDFWDPATSGATVVLSFADGTSLTQGLTALHSDEDTGSTFFGFIGSGAFTSVRLNEPFEVNSFGNEEVAIDNLMAATVSPVPEPATMALFASGLLALGAKARRMRDPDRARR